MSEVEDLAKQLKDKMAFFVVDTNILTVATDKFGVQNTPTIKIIVSKQAVDECLGADLD